MVAVPAAVAVAFLLYSGGAVRARLAYAGARVSSSRCRALGRPAGGEPGEGLLQGELPGPVGPADPPPETGRNPTAVAGDLISGVLLVPGAVVALVVLFLLAGYLRFATAPTPTVSLDEALSSLIAIEDEFYGGYATSGLPVKISSWFHYTQLDRRLEFEAQGLPGPARSRALALGKEAVEDLATIVEYSGYAPNGGVVDARETGQAADRFAKAMAAMDRPELQEMGAKGLRAGRKALSDAVRVIDEAKALQQE